MNVVFKVLYVFVRWNSLFDMPILSRLKNQVYSSFFRAHKMRVLRNVLISSPHKSQYAKIAIGKNFEAGSFVTIDYSGGLTIGDEVTVSEGSKVYTHSHTVADATIHWRRQPVTYASLEIGDGAWVASNCIILHSCNKIGKGAIVGAGSVVSKDVPDYAVVVGSPAKIVKYRAGII